MSRPYRRVALITVSALLLALAAPVFAAAAPAPAASAARPQMVLPDTYEPDDTTATAKALPEESIHSISNSTDASGNYVHDVDMFTLTAEETGTPFVIEASQVSGYFACVMGAYETSATGELVQLDMSMGVWGLTIGNTMFFRAPHPGTFYVGLEPAMLGNGVYSLHVSKGLARRIAGEDRYETAAAVSRLTWPNADNPIAQFIGQVEDTSVIGPAGCVLARGDDFADALSGAAFAGMSATDRPLSSACAMPVLLTRTDYAPAATVDEIWRLSQQRLWMSQPFTVYILGGEDAISGDVEAEIEALNGDQPFNERLRVVRVAGDNRFDTAAKVASLESSTGLGTADTAFLVNGYSFADALAAAPVAAWAHGPVLMTHTASLPDETEDYLLTHPEMHYVIVAGSSSTIATSVLDEIEAAPLSREVIRIGGANRYETAAMLGSFGVEELKMNPAAFMVVSGETFPDGLAAAPMTAFNGGALLLTRADRLSEPVLEFYDSHAAHVKGYPLYVVGGSASVSDDVFDQLNEYWMD